MRCQVCQSVVPPKSAPRVAYERPQRFNERVVTDVFSIWDADKVKYSVVHAVDAFSLYQVATLMKTPRSDHVAHFLKNHWIGVFGPPEVLLSDAGTEYAADTESLLRAFDVCHEMVPPATKWRMGLGERHGAVLKLLVMKTIYATSAKGYSETKECVMAATALPVVTGRLAYQVSPQRRSCWERMWPYPPSCLSSCTRATSSMS